MSMLTYFNLLIKVYVNINLSKARKYYSIFFFHFRKFSQRTNFKKFILKTCYKRKNINVFATHFKEI